MIPNSTRLKWFLLASPVLVLVLTRLGIEFCVRHFRPEISWIPAFMGYYLAIMLVLLLAVKWWALPIQQVFTFSFKPFPRFNRFFWGVIFPALLPLGVFILQLKLVPLTFIFYIVVFACVNPFFEEGFWRGLLFFLPGTAAFRIIYSAVFFSFSHFFLWGYWFKTPAVIIPTVISTFIMGIAWMWFTHKERNLLYPVLSHVLVDIFNLSVAVYYGLLPLTHF